MDLSSFNTEGLLSQGRNQFESMEDFCHRLEENNVSDEEILSKFDENQLDYIQDLKESPDWQELSQENCLERIKDAVSKFCHNTEIGRYWIQEKHWKPMAAWLKEK